MAEEQGWQLDPSEGSITLPTWLVWVGGVVVVVLVVAGVLLGGHGQHAAKGPVKGDGLEATAEPLVIDDCERAVQAKLDPRHTPEFPEDSVQVTRLAIDRLEITGILDNDDGIGENPNRGWTCIATRVDPSASRYRYDPTYRHSPSDHTPRYHYDVTIAG